MKEPTKSSSTRRKSNASKSPTAPAPPPPPPPPSVAAPVVGAVLTPQAVPLIIPGARSATQLQVQAQFWQSPYPPPDAAERFEKLCPGAFDRMLTMAEKAQGASIQANTEAMGNLKGDSRRGHWLGWLATMAAIGGAAFCASIRQPWVAAALVGVPVLSVAKALVEATKTKSPPIIAAPPAVPDQQEGKE